MQPPHTTHIHYRTMETPSATAPCIGILALQGAFVEHGKIIRELGARTVEVSDYGDDAREAGRARQHCPSWTSRGKAGGELHSCAGEREAWIEGLNDGRYLRKQGRMEQVISAPTHTHAHPTHSLAFMQ